MSAGKSFVIYWLIKTFWMSSPMFKVNVPWSNWYQRVQWSLLSSICWLYHKFCTKSPVFGHTSWWALSTKLNWDVIHINSNFLFKVFPSWLEKIVWNYSRHSLILAYQHRHRLTSCPQLFPTSMPVPIHPVPKKFGMHASLPLLLFWVLDLLC